MIFTSEITLQFQTFRSLYKSYGDFYAHFYYDAWRSQFFVDSGSDSFRMCSMVSFVVLCMLLNHDNFLLVLWPPEWCVVVNDRSVEGLGSLGTANPSMEQ